MNTEVIRCEVSDYIAQVTAGNHGPTTSKCVEPGISGRNDAGVRHD